MDPARIAELLEPFLGPASDRRLTTGDLQNISTYIDILLRWNARINLTAIRDPEQIVTRHFGESLFAARHLFPGTAHLGTGAVGGPAERALRVADFGSGAGFPGLPIRLWAPNIALTLIESNGKKVAFLREVARALTLTDVNVLHGRAQDLGASTFDVVTFRAVERFAYTLPVAAQLIAPGGRLALLIGTAQVETACITLPSFSWQIPMPVPLSRSRVLLVASDTR